MNKWEGMSGTTVPLGSEPAPDATDGAEHLALSIEKMTDGEEGMPAGSAELAVKLGDLNAEQIAVLDRSFSLSGNSLADFRWLETAEQVTEASELLSAWLDTEDTSDQTEAGKALAKYVGRL